MPNESVSQNRKLTNVPVAQIELTDRATQSRVKMYDSRITEYTEAIGRGEDLFEKASDPVQLFHDGTKYWIGDGWHRVSAAIRLHKTHILARVTTGGKDDAIYVAVGANATHGIQRTNEDKRRAVLLALQHPQLRRRSDRSLAQYVRASHTYVQNLRKEMSGNVASQRGGNVATTRPRREVVRRDPNDAKAQGVIDALRSLYDNQIMADLGKLGGVPLSDEVRVDLGAIAADLIGDLTPFAIATDSDEREDQADATDDDVEVL